MLSLRAYEFRLNAIELETDFEPGLPPVLGDGGQLQQALLNLLLNAEQAMRGRTPRRIRVGARHVAESDAVELFIADSGHGIPDENLRRIFDPFFTTREVGEGTGLGLSICYGIVRDHGGQIRVESRVGRARRSRSCCRRAGRARPGEPLRRAGRAQRSRPSATTSRPRWPAGGTACVAAERGEAPRAAAKRAASTPRSSIAA